MLLYCVEASAGHAQTIPILRRQNLVSKSRSKALKYKTNLSKTAGDLSLSPALRIQSPVQLECCAYQSQMCKCLWKITQMFAGWA
jgi:hypothetical protein